MKQLILTLSLFPFLGFTQSLTPEVVSNSGDSYSNTSTQLSWTLGEIAIDTYSASSNQLTQGFHQPERPTLSITDLDHNISINAYPNPFNSAITIQIQDLNQAISIVIYNAIGQQVFTDNYIGNGPKTMNLASLESGIYMIQFKTSSEVIKTIKIQKL